VKSGRRETDVPRAACRALSLALAVAVCATTPALGQAPGLESDAAPPGASDPGRRTIGRLPVNLGRGLVGAFHRDNLAPLLVGGAASGAVSFADDSVRDAVADPESGFGKALETGGGVYASVFVVSMFAGGRLAHGQRFRAMTYDLLDAMLVNGAYTQLLKAAVGRERPDGSNDKSFPSGHASNAFALASVAERHYGWKVGAPAYALAAAVGYSRIVRDKHYLSDVVAGASLGYIVGRTVVRVNDRPLATQEGRPGVTWSVTPRLTRHEGGLELRICF
jgi:hypothetical protein